MNRRSLLTTATLALPALALAACGTPTGTATVDPTQAIADAGILTKGIAGVYNALVLLYPGAVSGPDQTKVAADLAAARAALTGLSAVAPALTNATSLQGIETAVNDVLGIISSIPGLPPQITAGVTAATVLLPLIEVVVNQLQGKTVVAAAMVAPPEMTPDQARLVLKAAGGR
jgi:hypothetical protein